MRNRPCYRNRAPFRERIERGSDSADDSLSGMSRYSLIFKRARRRLRDLITDDRGGEVLEYALVTGLIVIAGVAIINAVGCKIVNRWNSIDAGL